MQDQNVSVNGELARSFDFGPGRRAVVLFPALLLFLLLTFPGDYLPLKAGLDSSSFYAMNYLPDSGLRYGSDVTFTYGPLGFLLYPMDIASNLAVTAGFRLLVHLLFGLGITYAGLRIAGVFPALLFMAAYLFAALFGLKYESQLVVTGALWAAIAVQNAQAGNFSLPPLAALAAACVFIEPALALSLVTMTCLAELARFLRGYTRFYAVLLRSAGPFAVLSAALWLRFFGAWEPFRAWVIMTLEYMRYNAVAMATDGPRSELIAGVFCVAAFAGASIVLMRMRSEVSVVAIILFPTLFTLFKHGFERQDEHVMFFFAPYIGLVAVLILVSRRYDEVALVCLLFLGTVLVITPIASARSAYRYSGAVDLLSGEQGLANIKAMANLSETRHRLEKAAEENLASVRLPDSWTLLIKENRGAMDVLPSEIMYCPANGIPWIPNPTVQTHLAYTALLDERLARHFSTGSAPDFLVIDWREFDQRCLPFDVPATWRTLLKYYRLVDVETDRKLLLLARRGVPVMLSPLPSKELTVTFEQWVEVPATEGILVAAPQFQLTWKGHMMKTALRVPPIFIEFEFAGGETQRRRILPETAAHGIVVNSPPLEQFDAVRAFSGLPSRSVVRFRITGPGTRYYAQNIPLTLTQMNVVARSEDALALAQPPL
ncbi:MAG TPA: hypothetical protein PKY01_07995 [Candidatus Hydrogenedentes bacterium]|nr:hypothetical protein [Candidatus Hydrogenedentota bacterium]HQM49732.1 hypothetical protein [Candidatus Hydrogenedentota bacterium]